jgi:hypothetical protein
LTSDNGYKIAVGINYYDDLKGLMFGLDAKPGYYDKVDKIYLIDGKYEGRTDPREYDHEAALRAIAKYPKVEVIDMDGRKQIDKRNMYLNAAEVDGMDFLIVLDSDEWLEITDTSVLHALKKRDSLCFPIASHMAEIYSQARPRLFKAPFTYRHRQSTTPNTISHGSLYLEYGLSTEDEVINQMYRWFVDHPNDKRGGVRGFSIHHDKQFRTEDRVIRDRIYYDEVKDR